MLLFSLLPYFPADMDLHINRLHLFTFWKSKDKYILDEKVRARMEQFCSMYVDANLKPLEHIAIAVIDGNYDFARPSDDQLKDLERYMLALGFCSIIKNGDQWPSVSENFRLFHQPFDMTAPDVSYPAGSYFTINFWTSLEKTKLVRPDYIPNASGFYGRDDELFGAFANMIDAHSADDDYLFTVLNWIKYAYMNADGIMGESRIVMMATAFEMFFKLDTDKTENFALGLEDLLQVRAMDYQNPTTGTNQTGLPFTQQTDAAGNIKTKSAGRRVPRVPIEHCIYGWWARDFYALRSEIVHDGKIDPARIINSKGHDHFRLALLIFKFCFYKALINLGYMVFPIHAGVPAGAPEILKILSLRKIERLL